MKVTKGYFENPTRGRIKFPEVVQEIINYILEDKSKDYSVIVGCDSSSEEDPLFPVAIVVLRKGHGGRFFLKKIHFRGGEAKKFKNWKMRILEEVMLSCKLALSLREELEKRILNFSSLPKFEFRYIHADIGENGATREMIKEVTGLIRGNGFEPKIKPESYVASGVADKYC